MSYFPAFIKFDNINLLIIGGGNIASEKVGHLLDFTSNITVLSPKLSKEMENYIKNNNIKYIEKYYHENDIDGFDIVIIAVDDIKLQAKIYKEAKRKHILCNAVDSVDYCDFIFPSYIKKGDLTIAISTSGASPAVAKHLRIFLEKLIPNSIVDFLKEMKLLRKTMPKGKERMEFLDKKAREYFEKI